MKCLPRGYRLSSLLQGKEEEAQKVISVCCMDVLYPVWPFQIHGLAAVQESKPMMLTVPVQGDPSTMVEIRLRPVCKCSASELNPQSCRIVFCVLLRSLCLEIVSNVSMQLYVIGFLLL